MLDNHQTCIGARARVGLSAEGVGQSEYPG